MKMFRLLLLAVAVSAVVVTGTTDAAAARSRTTKYFRTEVRIVGECDGFVLTERLTDSRTYTTYYNSSGDAIRATQGVTIKGTITNSASGKTFATSASYTQTTDWVTGIETYDGTLTRISSRGKTLILDKGKVTFDAEGDIVSRSGRFDTFDAAGGAEALYCSKLV